MGPDDRDDSGGEEAASDTDPGVAPATTPEIETDVDIGVDVDADIDAEEWQFGADGPIAPPITPGSPSLEHVVFVLLGVAITLLALAQLVL